MHAATIWGVYYFFRRAPCAATIETPGEICQNQQEEDKMFVSAITEAQPASATQLKEYKSRNVTLSAKQWKNTAQQDGLKSTKSLTTKKHTGKSHGSQGLISLQW